MSWSPGLARTKLRSSSTSRHTPRVYLDSSPSMPATAAVVDATRRRPRNPFRDSHRRDNWPDFSLAFRPSPSSALIGDLGVDPVHISTRSTLDSCSSSSLSDDVPMGVGVSPSLSRYFRSPATQPSAPTWPTPFSTPTKIAGVSAILPGTRSPRHHVTGSRMSDLSDDSARKVLFRTPERDRRRPRSVTPPDDAGAPFHAELGGRSDRAAVDVATDTLERIAAAPGNADVGRLLSTHVQAAAELLVGVLKTAIRVGQGDPGAALAAASSTVQQMLADAKPPPPRPPPVPQHRHDAQTATQSGMGRRDEADSGCLDDDDTRAPSGSGLNSVGTQTALPADTADDAAFDDRGRGGSATGSTQTAAAGPQSHVSFGLHDCGQCTTPAAAANPVPPPLSPALVALTCATPGPVFGLLPKRRRWRAVWSASDDVLSDVSKPFSPVGLFAAPRPSTVVGGFPLTPSGYALLRARSVAFPDVMPSVGGFDDLYLV